MTTAIILTLVYLLGLFICYEMLRIEQLAEQKNYTIGDRLLAITLSLLSWLWVIIILILTWVKKINDTGYWDTPLYKDEKKKEVAK